VPEKSVSPTSRAGLPAAQAQEVDLLH